MAVNLIAIDLYPTFFRNTVDKILEGNTRGRETENIGASTQH
jgi:hypothetical protein